MLKTYSFIRSSFILCLFGLTLITVSPVFAEDSAAFVECQNIKQSLIGKDFGLMKEKKDCFKRLARELQALADKKKELRKIANKYRSGRVTTFQTDPQTLEDEVKELCGYMSQRSCQSTFPGSKPCGMLQQLCQGQEIVKPKPPECSDQNRKICGW